MAHNHAGKRHVQTTRNPLPKKPSPSVGPERMNDLEEPCGNRHHADKYRADDRNEHDVAQHQESCQDHYNSKQNADPKGWRGHVLGVQMWTVIGGHVVLLSFEPMESAIHRMPRSALRRAIASIGSLLGHRLLQFSR